jgi:hypothetical protein
MLAGLIAVCLLLALSTTPASAQPVVPAVEIAGGYSLLPANGDDFPRQTSHGFQASVSANVTHWFGVLGDVAVHFNTARDLGPGFVGRVARTRVTQYLAGPRFVARSGPVSVFAHGLVGLASGDAGEDFSGFSDTKLTFGGGGGVDVQLRPRLAIRGQFDLLASFADIVEGNTRFGVGLAVGLGGS